MNAIWLDSKLLDSNIWTLPPGERLVWITLLLMADESGTVLASVAELARVARVDVTTLKRALERFAAPDPYNLAEGHGGRRIEEIDGGWLVLERAAGAERLRAMNAARQARWRARQKLAREHGKLAREHGK